MDDEKWIVWEIQTSKKWTDMEDVLKYTNIDLIDEDHKMLMEYALKLNQVLDEVETQFSMALIKKTKLLLDKLFEYAKDHFEREEKFMALYELPNMDMHKREHQKILVMLKESLDSYNSGKVKLSTKLKFQVTDWLIKHINVVDYHYFDLSNWSGSIINAKDWDDVSQIICFTGITEIDNQHRILTEIALTGLKNISSHTTDEVITAECYQLTEYACYHFDFEKKFMEKYGIIDSDKHLLEHDHFINKINEYAVEIKEDATRLESMKEWVLTWWINHINTVDKAYFSYKNWAYQLIEKAERIEDITVILRKTGIEEIDNDHLVLMELTMKLNSLVLESDFALGKNMSGGDIKIKVLNMLDEIYQYAEMHFKREESMMVAYQMDDLRMHSAEHGEILDKLKGIKQNYIEGRLYLSSNIKTILLEWWILHTNTTDYKTFVQHFGAPKQHNELNLYE